MKMSLTGSLTTPKRMIGLLIALKNMTGHVMGQNEKLQEPLCQHSIHQVRHDGGAYALAASEYLVGARESWLSGESKHSLATLC